MLRRTVDDDLRLCVRAAKDVGSKSAASFSLKRKCEKQVVMGSSYTVRGNRHPVIIQEVGPPLIAIRDPRAFARLVQAMFSLALRSSNL